MVRTAMLRALFLASVVIATSGANCNGGPQPTPPLQPAPNRIVGVTIEPPTINLVISEERQLRVTVMPHPDNTQPINQAVTWATSQPSFVSVSTTGLVRGLALGNSVITATSVGDPTQRGAAVITVGRIVDF